MFNQKHVTTRSEGAKLSLPITKPAFNCANMAATETPHSIFHISQLFVFKRDLCHLAFIAIGNAASSLLIMLLNVANWNGL